MSPLSQPDQLRYITEGRVEDAVAKHAGGDWSRRNELFDLPRAVFDAWVDSEASLPTQRVHLEPATFDGIYLIQDGISWTVYEQERGWVDPRSLTRHPNFAEAKRQAFAIEYLWALDLR
jgi:hypothetical protein